MKQVIVIRKDLKMRRGKEIAQGAHASMKWMLHWFENSFVDEDREGRMEIHGILLDKDWRWLFDTQKKVTLQVSSEEELLGLHRAARDAGLISHYIVDSGLTEFHCVPTITALAIGPNRDADIDKITGHLQLY